MQSLTMTFYHSGCNSSCAVTLCCFSARVLHRSTKTNGRWARQKEALSDVLYIYTSIPIAASASAQQPATWSRGPAVQLNKEPLCLPLQLPTGK